MTDVDGQLRLRLKRGAKVVDIDTIRRQPSITKAVALCAELGGFGNDKDLCRALDIDTATWARIKSGQANFPHEKLMDLMDECGNEVPLIWLADRRGYDLQPQENELERRLRVEREANDKLSAENKLLRDLVQGKAA